MNSSLKKRHTASAVIICLMVHSLMIIGLAFIKIQESEYTPSSEPIVLIADNDQPEPPTPSEPNTYPDEQDWVAINNSLPDSQFMDTQQLTPDLDDGQQQHTTNDQTPAQETISSPPDTPELDEVIALATQFMHLVDKNNEAEELTASEPQEETKKAEPITQKVKALAPATTKQLTLAKLAQGFVSHMNNQMAAMQVVSDNEGQASADQLKKLSYCQKVIDCLVNSYKIRKNEAPHIKQENNLVVHLAINENGTINTLRIIQSSGHAALDQFVLDMFAYASSSFPPLPQSLAGKPFHLPFFNIEQLQSFQSPAWHIYNRH